MRNEAWRGPNVRGGGPPGVRRPSPPKSATSPRLLSRDRLEFRSFGDVRIDWATLLRRVWGFDVLACPRCGDLLRMISLIKDRDVIVRILEHLGLPTGEPRSHRARDPTWDDAV